MFIIWGTKRVERPLGQVAEFCPLCRDFRAFRLAKVGMASHVYYVSFGDGKIVGHTATCTACSHVMPVDPIKFSTPVREPVRDLEGLIQKTFPTIREVYAGRIDLEKRILSAPASLSPAEREALLLEPFQCLGPEVEARFKGETKFDKQSGIGCAGTIGLLLLLGVGTAVFAKPGRSEDAVLGAMAVVFFGGLVYTLIQLGLAPRRYIRNQILPQLATALRPLSPNRHELSACLEKFAAAGLQIGTRVKLGQLWDTINRGQ